MESGHWSLAIVAGPLIVIAIAIFLTMRKRLAPPPDGRDGNTDAATGQATRRQHDEHDAAEPHPDRNGSPRR